MEMTAKAPNALPTGNSPAAAPGTCKGSGTAAHVLGDQVGAHHRDQDHGEQVERVRRTGSPSRPPSEPRGRDGEQDYAEQVYHHYPKNQDSQEPERRQFLPHDLVRDDRKRRECSLRCPFQARYPMGSRPIISPR